ncbi:MAG: hypothetical protein JRH11_25555 [Deltaproteobacteria bacterium]|nr:hypothetical protein [Deltaproteobacteria bacterium]
MIAAWMAAGRDDPAVHEECEKLERITLILVREPSLGGRSPCLVGLGSSEYAQACSLGFSPSPFEELRFGVYVDTDKIEPGDYPNAVLHETGHGLHGCVLAGRRRQGLPTDWATSDALDRLHEDAELWGRIQNDASTRLANMLEP